MRLSFPPSLHLFLQPCTTTSKQTSKEARKQANLSDHPDPLDITIIDINIIQYGTTRREEMGR
jgi:hypothetical protein